MVAAIGLCPTLSNTVAPRLGGHGRVDGRQDPALQGRASDEPDAVRGSPMAGITRADTTTAATSGRNRTTSFTDARRFIAPAVRTSVTKRETGASRRSRARAALTFSTTVLTSVPATHRGCRLVEKVALCRDGPSRRWQAPRNDASGDSEGNA